jgi:CubicO group peptidase (beta-lactamase class C family)
MLVLKPSDWDRPITDFVPSLADYAKSHPAQDDLTRIIDWETVTLAALSSQIAGNSRDVQPADPDDYLTNEATAVLIEKYGFPPLNAKDPEILPPCEYNFLNSTSCPVSEYAAGGAFRPPLFLPWTSPAYTDFGYMLLGMATAKIAGTSIHDIYSQRIFQPLGMSSSHSQILNDTDLSRYVSAGDVAGAPLTPTAVLDYTVPSGGMFSTTNDLARWGTAILNYTLLKGNETRKWMKPVSHTAMFEYSAGKPWEIYRYRDQASGHITDIYTKLGDSGRYGGYLALIPDFDAGFSIITASPNVAQRSSMTPYIADIIIEQVMPALLAQARDEARSRLAGTYVSSDGKLNSSLTLKANSGAHPGLTITRFISNGSDVLGSKILGSNPVRIVPSIADLPNKKMAFRASPLHSSAPGLFKRQYAANMDWLTGDGADYGESIL